MCLAPLAAGAIHAAPLKVFILAGQSNMQGHASVTTFDYLAKDPKTAPILEEMRGKDGKPTVCDKYTENMAHFIRDVRKDLNAPKMPFVIGVLGVNGPVETFDGPRYKSTYQTFRDAQAAPASMPEFKGNVAAVLTENFWDHQLAAARDKKERTPEEEEIAKGASNQGFHYYGAAKFFGPAGKAFAEAFTGLK